ncbi:MAG TPA: nitroreductase family protein [Candidatus Scybalousia intestinigallinarum]|nr:nitroreductase family protein [Candidatus Scybalousia intestinigallinarum]
MSLTINIYYTGINGSAKKFAQEMITKGIVDQVRNEEGNKRYEYFFPENDPETVLLIDCWENQEALDFHHQSPMMEEIAKLREKYQLRMKVEQYVSYSKDNQDFETVIRNRTATRKFKDKKVEEEKLMKILEAGRLAPTAKNLQPQKIYVVRSEEALKKIDEVSPCRYNAPVVLMVCSDKNIAWTKDDYSTYEMDACIVATHMMLEATNVGVDNIWIEMFDKQKLKTQFNLPENIEPVCLIPLGYQDDDYKGNPLHHVRKELKETVEFI